MGAAKKPDACDSAPEQDYDPLYIDSSSEEDQMEDIQQPPPLSRPFSAAASPLTPQNTVLVRCFNELLKKRNEVSTRTTRLVSLPQFCQIAAKNKFANPDNLIHESSIHHLSLLTVEGECFMLKRQENASNWDRPRGLETLHAWIRRAQGHV